MPGKTMMLTAKISGIMPAELTRSGMNVVVAAVLAIAADALRMLNRNPPLSLIDEDDADDGHERDEDEE